MLINYNHEVARKIALVVEDIYKVRLTDTRLRACDHKAARHSYFLLCWRAGLSTYNMTEALGMYRNSFSALKKRTEVEILEVLRVEGFTSYFKKAEKLAKNITLNLY